MKLHRRPCPQASAPGESLPVRRVLLVVLGVTIHEQQRLYAALSSWDACRYAQGWAVPVHLVRRFCADFSTL